MTRSLPLLAVLLLAPVITLRAADAPTPAVTPAAALKRPETSSQTTRPDITLADFEQGYGDWTVQGEAFNHPTTRTQGTMGFVGKGLADSWDVNRMALAGSLTSPAFTIERRFIRFLVGGRGFNAKTSLQLFIDGRLEFFASGAGDRLLRPGAFDVSSFSGRKAKLVITDEGEWFHVAVDEVKASDSVPEGVRIDQPLSRCVPADKLMDLAGMRYLVVPINNRAPMVNCVLEVDGEPKKDLAIRLAIDEPPDFLASYPLHDLSGQKLRLISKWDAEWASRPADGSLYVDRTIPDAWSRLSPMPVVSEAQAEGLLGRIHLSAEPAQMDGVYSEAGRPRLHFTVKRGHSMDPNGLFRANGLYHIFYQYNPLGVAQGNNQWGHATSPDFFHWTERPIAIPNGPGWRSYSGSGVVDRGNVSGLKRGAEAPILLYYSQDAWPFSTTALAYSVDGGNTFRQYEKNPLFPTLHRQGHDPKVVWHAPGQKWVMIIKDQRNDVWGFDLYESRNLLDWSYLSTVAWGWGETPDLFCLPLDGDQKNCKWIVHDVGAKYQVGRFDGREFAPETEKLRTFKGEFGAAQTFNNLPDGRCVMMACLWGAPYYQNDPDLQVAGGLNLPVEVNLRTSPAGPRLYLNPVREIETLVSARQEFQKSTVTDLSAKLATIAPGLFDIEFEWDAAGSRDFQLKVWDRDLFAFTSNYSSYAIGDRKGKVHPVNGRIKVRLICDRSLVSFYLNDGYEAGNCYLAGFRPECRQALSLQGAADQVFQTFTVRTLRLTRPDAAKEPQ